MPKRSEVELYIYKSGVFDMDGVYNAIYKFFGQHKFVPFENVYKEKGSEQVYTIEGHRKVTGYLKYIIQVEMKLWKPEIVEVNKKKMTKSRIRVMFSSTIETDYEKRWDETQFMEKLRNFYEKYILKKALETKYDVEIITMTYKLHGDIKKVLEVEAD